MANEQQNHDGYNHSEQIYQSYYNEATKSYEFPQSKRDHLEESIISNGMVNTSSSNEDLQESDFANEEDEDEYEGEDIEEDFEADDGDDEEDLDEETEDENDSSSTHNESHLNHHDGSDSKDQFVDSIQNESGEILK